MSILSAIFRHALPFAVAALMIATPGVLAHAQDGAPMILPVHPVPLVAETNGKNRQFSIEIADDADERSRGLMFRHDMPDDRGMLFIFEQTRRVAFWMKDTPMPLDLVFIGEDGKVKAVLPGEPYSVAPIAPSDPIRFVLELKAGTAQKTGIQPGIRIHHPEIDAVVDG